MKLASTFNFIGWLTWNSIGRWLAGACVLLLCGCGSPTYSCNCASQSCQACKGSGVVGTDVDRFCDSCGGRGKFCRCVLE